MSDLIRNKPKDRFAGYQKIVNQPFKHIVVDSGRIVEDIYIENSNQHSVYIAEKEDVSKAFSVPPERLTVSVSFGSSIESSMIETLIDFEFSPGANINAPLAGAKSAPLVALPALVA